MNTSFTLEQLPLDVDASQCFTTNEFKRIPQDFNLDVELAKVARKPDFSANLDIYQLQIFIDQRLSLSWDEGKITFEIFLLESYRPESTTITINGEIGLIIANGEVYLNRISKLDLNSLINKSYAARRG